MRINQMARGHGLRTATRITVLLGTAILSTVVSGVAYAATQPPQPQPLLRLNIGLGESTSADPTALPTITDSPTATAEPTVTITQPTIPEPPATRPTPPSNGGAGGGSAESNKNSGKTSNANTTDKSVRAATTASNDESLPLTGSNISNLIVLGGLLTAGGVGLVVTARRRRTS